MPHLVAMMVGHTSFERSAAALAWLVQAGVDTAIDTAPRNWLQAAVMRPVANLDRQPVAVAAARAPVPPLATRAATASVTVPALAAATLADLDIAVAAFDYPLRRSDVAPQLLVGNPDSRVIILCDQPEDAVAPAAVLRARMLAAIGLDAGNHVLLHRIPWPMPGGRSPNDAELSAFAAFVDRALTIVRPRAVLALGQLAGALAGDDMARASARGRWADIAIGDTPVPLLATCHPRLLLNQPARKREAWADLQAFAARLAVTA